MQRHVWAGFLAILALVLLIGGLNSLELQSASGLPKLELGQDSIEFPAFPRLSPDLREFLSFVLMVGFWLLLPVSIIYLVVSPSGRKRVLIMLAVLTLNAYVLLVLLRGVGLNQIGTSPLQPPPMPTLAADLAPKLQPVDPPGWLAPAIAFLLTAAIAAVALLLWNRRKGSETIPDVAERAVRELREGRRFSDVILDCYDRMCRFLANHKGIRRPGAMTPREFEHILLEAGFDPDAIRTLTRLFEQVRYGEKELDAIAHSNAERSLQVIAGAQREV